MIDEVIKILQNAKQPQSDFVKLMDNFKNPYLVLIACILSLRTNDKTTYPATLRMLDSRRARNFEVIRSCASGIARTVMTSAVLRENYESL